MSKKINLDKMSRQTQLVGHIRSEIIEHLELDLIHKEVIIYPGVIKHIKERHPYTFKKYFYRLVDMIRMPDYIGIGHRNNSTIELIKNYKDYILVALKIQEGRPIFIASMYIITENAMKKRLDAGKLYQVQLDEILDSNKTHYKNIKRYKC